MGVNNGRGESETYEFRGIKWSTCSEIMKQAYNTKTTIEGLALKDIFHFMPPIKISKTHLMSEIGCKTNHNDLTRQEIFRHKIATLSCFVLKFDVVTV